MNYGDCDFFATLPFCELFSSASVRRADIDGGAC